MKYSLNALACWCFNVMCLFVLGCSTTVTQSPSHFVIIDAKTSQAVDYEELVKKLSEAEYVLLGEEHDQALHHSQRAELIRLLTSKRKTLVSFEHVSVKYEELLREHIQDPVQLRKVLDWDNSGWPHWDKFRPLFAAVADASAVPVAGMRPNQAKLEDYGLAAKLPHQERLEKILRDSHPPSAKFPISKMVAVQRSWDAGMAASLDSNDAQSRILLAGNGHVRKDFGVPWYLAFKHPDASIVAVGFWGNRGTYDLSTFDYVFKFD